MVVRRAEASDSEAWLDMRGALWPGPPREHAAEIEAYFADLPSGQACLMAFDGEGRAVGFAEVGLRDHAEECRSSPVGYLEGIYVQPERRLGGVGRALVRAAVDWALALGCSEMASDRALDDEVSGAFHEAVGFEEVHRIVCYRLTPECAA